MLKISRRGTLEKHQQNSVCESINMINSFLSFFSYVLINCIILNRSSNYRVYSHVSY